MSDKRNYYILLCAFLLSLSGMGLSQTFGDGVTESFIVKAKYGAPDKVKNTVHTDYILILKNECNDIVSVTVTPETYYKASVDKKMYFELREHEKMCHEFPWYVGPAAGVPLMFSTIGLAIGLVVLILHRIFE